MTDPTILWQQLQHAGLVEGSLPASQDNQQPAFFLRILLGASGWLSALFFTGFVSAFFISFLSDSSHLWIIGVILCLFSIWISRIANLPILLQQFVFACSLAGQAQILFGVFDSTGSGQISAAVMLGLEILLFVLIGIRSQRTVAIVIACGALLWLLEQHAWIYAVPLLSAAAGWLWLNRLRFYKYAAYLQPATTGLTLALCLTIFSALVINNSEFAWWDIKQGVWQSQLWIAAVLTSTVGLILAWQLIQQNVQQTQLHYMAILISLGIALLNLKMLGLAPLCLLLCIGVVQAHTRLIWLMLFCLAGYLMLYYYSLNNSLLYKSILLSGSGVVLLALYAVLNRYARNWVMEPNKNA